MYPISGKVRRSHGGGTLRSAHALRAVRLLSWLEVGSVKSAPSRPAPRTNTGVMMVVEPVEIHQRVTPTVGQPVFEKMIIPSVKLT
jgi:hypothetical protein